jgi:hypothetical protein
MKGSQADFTAENAENAERKRDKPRRREKTEKGIRREGERE